MTWQPQQLDNLRAALAVVDARKLDEITAQQVITGILTETTAWNYENPLFPVTKGLGDGMPPTVLAPSTKESCGVFQQRPHVPVWWGPDGLSLDQQAVYFMSVANATGLFLDRLVNVPRTAEPWREIQAVQGSEYNGNPLPYAANYESNWATGAQLLAQLRAETPTDWYDMVTQDQALALTKQALQEWWDSANVIPGVVEGVRNADVGGFPLAMVLNTLATSRADEIIATNVNVQQIETWIKGGYTGAERDDNNIAGIWLKVDGLVDTVASLAANLDALTKLVEALTPVPPTV